MTSASNLRRLRSALVESAGTIVFGMEDGTVSIFGLIFGVAATTTDPKTVLIAGASGAVAAAVSMMAGAYLDIETTRDEANASRAMLQADLTLASDSIAVSLTERLIKAGLTSPQCDALVGAVQHDRQALGSLLQALQGAPDRPLNPWEQALWMLLADFFAAAVPILPFVFLAVPQARVVSGIMTFALLVCLGIGRARIAKRDQLRTIAETVAIGIAAALAGVLISEVINRWFTG